MKLNPAKPRVLSHERHRGRITIYFPVPEETVITHTTATDGMFKTRITGTGVRDGCRLSITWSDSEPEFRLAASDGADVDMILSMGRKWKLEILELSEVPVDVTSFPPLGGMDDPRRAHYVIQRFFSGRYDLFIDGDRRVLEWEFDPDVTDAIY